MEFPWDNIVRSTNRLGRRAVPFCAFRARAGLFSRHPPPSKIIKIRFNFSLNFNLNLTSFLIVLGSLWVAILGHFGHLNRPKMASSRFLNRHFLQKVDFQKNERHPRREHDFGPKTAPKTTQDRPKTAPRRSSRAFFFRLRFCLRFWFVLGCLFDTMLGPKMSSS